MFAMLAVRWRYFRVCIYRANVSIYIILSSINVLAWHWQVWARIFDLELKFLLEFTLLKSVHNNQLNSFLFYHIELAQLSGIAAILRFPMPELEDEDEDENENGTEDSDSDNWFYLIHFKFICIKAIDYGIYLKKRKLTYEKKTTHIHTSA